MKPVLEAKQLSKRYPGSSAPALDSVTFSVDRGEFVGIMGASGSGKTTLLNVLSTIDRPTSGEILISGVSLGTLNDGRGADFSERPSGFIFQEYFLLDSLTIRENISVPLALKKIPAKRIASAVRGSRNGSASPHSLTNILPNFPAVSGRELPQPEPS